MKVLLFAPHSAVWIHAFPEALVAEALVQAGNEVAYVGCGGLLASHCISMSAFGVPFEATPAEKTRVCRLCKGNAEVVRTQFGFEGPNLEEMITDDDVLLADRLAASVTPETCGDLVLDGVAVGRIAAYELLIQSKKGALDFTPGEWARYLASLKNVILVLQATQRIFRDLKPDRVLVYNALYSVNRTVCRLAELHGIPQYFLHAGNSLANRLQTLILARDHAYSYFAHMRDKWTEMQNRPCSSSAMKAGTDHFLEVIKGRSVWAYSAAPKDGVDLKKFFRIEAAQKVISATMSSDDEFFAGQMIGTLSCDPRLLFPKQVDWIRALIAYVEKRRDLCLIVRVHPREFPNKREGVLSEHAKKLKAVLSVLPNNVKVNWPTDNISLYDLANITDVFANAWSSAGKEMAWLGLPVVLYSRDITLYPANLNYVGTTELEYFQKIEQALREGWNPERIRKTYRWCAIEYQYSLLDISESFSKSENSSVFSKGINKLMRSIAPFRSQRADCRNRSVRLTSSEKINRIFSNQLNTVLDLDDQGPPISLSEETDFLKREVYRLLEGLYGRNIHSNQNSLASKLRTFANS